MKVNYPLRKRGVVRWAGRTPPRPGAAMRSRVWPGDDPDLPHSTGTTVLHRQRGYPRIFGGESLFHKTEYLYCYS